MSAKTRWSVTTVVAVAVFGTLAVAGSAREVQRQTAAGLSRTVVARGEYLVSIMGCHDCHTPKKMGPNGPEPDMSRALSGHPEDSALPAPPALPNGPWAAVTSWDLTAWSGPWGVSYPFNLTPDENTGLGIWTEEMFVKAMRTGRHMGASRPILPPMPWQVVANLNDQDIKAVYAYLRSIPPIKNRVPEPIIIEPADTAGAAQ